MHRLRSRQIITNGVPNNEPVDPDNETTTLDEKEQEDDTNGFIKDLFSRKPASDFNIENNSGEIKPINNDRHQNPGNWETIPDGFELSDNLRESNPNYKNGDEWTINCQRCVPTFEMRCRGFDVTALPKPEGSDYLSYHPFDVWEAPNVLQCTDRGVSDIQNIMQDWGDGSRAQVVVVWENTNSGHTFFTEQVEGKTHFYDPQTSESDVSYYFDMVEKERTKICQS
jgi:hypothetical protein